MSLELFNNPGNAAVELIESFPGNISLFLKREDQLHPQVSGNKWRKLKYNMIRALETNQPRILTFGGAFSNHIYATAAAGAACGVPTIGFIRGEVLQPLNDTLEQATSWGMKLVALSREDYRKKSDPEFLDQLTSRYGKGYVIPEGGTNSLAIRGCAEIANTPESYDYWCVSCGTGGTLAGLVVGLKQPGMVLGFPALKGGDFLENEIGKYLVGHEIDRYVDWQLITEYHFGGYAKISLELIEFIRHFHHKYKVLLDPIYTGKMMYGIFDMIKNGYFKANSRILALHTGGLQGISGIEKKHGIKVK